RVEAFGSEGMAISTNRTTSNLRLYGAKFTDEAPPLLNFFIERYDKAFAAEIDAFVDAVEKGTAPEVGFEDGRKALMLAEAANLSIREGRTVRVQELG
ncbi:MAG: inositol 2-dehydrogenase, partial [Pseudomonadota bacterium]|nr:inositol 2-dehydrogenase [Pseudomonadota bacterium]